MRRSFIIVPAMVTLAVAVVVAVVAFNGGRAAATGTGPTISIGTASLVSGNVNIPIMASGAVADPYIGFNLHLRWDPTVFTFSSANSTGGVFPQPFCPPAVVDPDNAGAVFACTNLGSGVASTGLLATFVLTPASGCSLLHLFSLLPPDNGDSNTATYTVNEADFSIQDNVLGPDVGVNAAGQSCTPAGSPTSTPTPSLTPTVTDTPTPSVTPTPTVTPVFGQPDVTVSGFGFPVSADSGATVSLSITGTNIGSGAAQNVVVDVALPPGAVPFLNSSCLSYFQGHFFCSLGDLAANDNAPGGPDQASVVASIQMPFVTAPSSITTGLAISASNEPAGNTGNNTATIHTSLSGCPDLNGDDTINMLDFSTAAASFGLHQGQPGYNPLVDQNGDNTITIADLAIMGTRFQQQCRGLDSDHDGLTNYDETHTYLTDPNNPDTDGDGLPDGVEVTTFGSNPLVVDTDGDGYTDGEEAQLGKNPRVYCQIMASDLNKDHQVNMLDLSIAAAAFQTHSGQPGFNPKADIDHDGVISMLDLSIMASHFQQSIMLCP